MTSANGSTRAPSTPHQSEPGYATHRKIDKTRPNCPRCPARCGAGSSFFAAALLAEAVKHGDEPALGPLFGNAQIVEHARAEPVLDAQHAEQDVFGADVVVSEPQRVADGQLEYLLRLRRERNVLTYFVHAGRAQPGDDGLAYALERDAQSGNGLGAHALRLVQQAEQDVLAGDVVVSGLARLLLGGDRYGAGAVGETAEYPGVEFAGLLGLLRDEAFLRRLLADPHVLADLGPRRA